MMRKCFKIFGVLALALALVLRPDSAYAWDFIYKGVLYQGIIDADYGTNLYGAVVSSYNEFDAACYVLGTDPGTLSASVKQKLSDANYGGKFYEYAQTFYTQSGALSDVPPWVPTYVVMVGELSDLLLADYQAVWYSSASKTLHDYALQDFKRVLAGEDLSGGGDDTPSSPVSGEPLVFTGNPHLNNWGSSVSTGNYYAIRDSNKNAVASVDVTNKGGLPVVPAPVTFTVSNYGSFSFDPSQYNFYMYVSYWSNNSNDVYFAIFAVPSTTDVNLVSRANGGGADVWYSNATFPSTTCYYIELHGKYSYTDGSFAVSSFYYNSGWKTSSRSSIGSANNYSAKGMECIYTYGSGGPVSPPPPAGDWPEPETPVTPTAPEQPTPTAPTVTPDPTITEPTPTWPDVTININPDPTVSVTPTGLDYTELLTRINDNLNTINSYSVSINSNLNSLRSDLVTEFESVEQGLKNIYQYLQHFDNLLERHCKHLRDALDDGIYGLELYLKQLFEWLPNQLSFDFDDSSIVLWLKQIYYKLGGGTSAPNPIVDPGGFFEWLGGLVTGFLSSVLSGLPGKIQELVSDVTDLTEYFPFSAPWDLYGLLLLFAHQPVTPVFSIPWGVAAGQTVDIVVDCSQWDSVMAIVRSVEKIIFAGGLAKLTFDMFRPTDVMGD